MFAGEGDAGFGVCASDGEREITSVEEKISVIASPAEQPLSDEHFNPPIGPGAKHFLRRGIRQRFQHCPTPSIIDRPPIVRIDQAEIPDLVSLVNVRHAWPGQLEDDLRERIDRAEARDLFNHRQKDRKKFVLRTRLKNLRDKCARRHCPTAR